MLAKDIVRTQAIEVQLISLRARLDQAQNFELNISMHVEGVLLLAQINALQGELDRMAKEE